MSCRVEHNPPSLINKAMTDLLAEAKSIRPSIWSLSLKARLLTDGTERVAFKAKDTEGNQWLGDTPEALIQDIRENAA